MRLHVTAPQTALAKHALGDRVHGDQLDFLAEGRAHLVHHLADRNELRALLVNIFLIDFISHDQNVLTMADSHDRFQIFAAHNLSGRVARVDHNHSPKAETFILRLRNHLFKFLDIETPVLALVQVVGKQLASVECQ